MSGPPLIAALGSLLQESVGTPKAAAQAIVMRGADWIRLVLEAAGIVIIAIGGAAALWLLISAAMSPRKASFSAARLTLARYLALALEFQLAADILETAIAPEWPQIGELAAIAAIRTALNYFLSREIRQEREQTQADITSSPSGGSTRQGPS